MIVYRFSNRKYGDDLSGTGAKLFGGRWNHKGLAGLYTSSSISLSLIEVLVNAHTLDQLQSLTLLKLEIPSSIENPTRELVKLKEDWINDMEYSRFIGSEFLQNRSFLMLRCPSSVVQEEWNYLLNPLHADYKKLSIVSVEDYKFDQRLFKLRY